MSDQFKVNDQAPLGLNLRREPDPTANNIQAVIPFGHEVKKLEESTVPNWWKVETTLNETVVTGFVNKKFLTPSATTPTPDTHDGVVPVHLFTSDVTRQNRKYPFALSEEPPVKRHQTDAPAVRVSAIGQLIDWLKVQSSDRYRPTGGMTFCNIYAYDYCFVTGAYLPRVWWTQHAISKLEAGQTVAVEYGVSVNEINANGLNDWFKEWGTHFDWRRTFDLTEMQDAANQGRVCITVGKAKPASHHGHGHIVAVVPETAAFKALRQNGNVIRTVQSQAGAHNHDYIVQRWWDDGTYADFGHWIHE